MLNLDSSTKMKMSAADSQESGSPPPSPSDSATSESAPTLVHFKQEIMPPGTDVKDYYGALDFALPDTYIPSNFPEYRYLPRSLDFPNQKLVDPEESKDKDDSKDDFKEDFISSADYSLPNELVLRGGGVFARLNIACGTKYGPFIGKWETQPLDRRFALEVRKGWSIWDHVARTKPESIADRSNGDIATNSYHLYKRDVQMLKELGVANYRFSISWPRIMPYGRSDYVNPLGVAYYNALIDELIANGIQPFVTIYHWDLPQNLQEQGGWLNEDIVNWFGDYARVLYENFGDRVKYWITINEPHVHCYQGYGYATHAPLINSPGVGYYECGRNLLLANARAYHIYNDEFRVTQNGQVGFVICMEWPIKHSDSEDDSQAIVDHHVFNIGHFMNPIFTEEGNYPQILIDKVAIASFRQGLNASRLRPFTREQIEYMKGTADFLGLNHYTSKIVYRNASVYGMHVVPSVDDDTNYATYHDPSWPDYGFSVEYGPGLYSLLIYLRDTYNNITIYITENGCSQISTDRNDDERVQFYRNYLTSVLNALAEGVNVKGYFAWSLMDNFEWAFGYTVRFGLYEVDINDPNRTRTPKKSALVYKEIVRSRVIDYEYNPNPYAKTNSSTQANNDGNQLSRTPSVASSIYIACMVVIFNIIYLY